MLWLLSIPFYQNSSIASELVQSTATGSISLTSLEESTQTESLQVLVDRCLQCFCLCHARSQDVGSSIRAHGSDTFPLAPAPLGKSNAALDAETYSCGSVRRVKLSEGVSDLDVVCSKNAIQMSGSLFRLADCRLSHQLPSSEN